MFWLMLLLKVSDFGQSLWPTPDAPPGESSFVNKDALSKLIFIFDIFDESNILL